MHLPAHRFDAQLPAWTSAAFTAVGMILMALYQHFLERRSKRLDHQLRKDSIVFEKQFAFVQERHAKRLDALDSLGTLLMEFDHALRHIAEGDHGYTPKLHDYSARARNLARENESLLGREIYDAVLAWTDAGRAILEASFCVTDRTVAVARANGLPADHLARLQNIVGTKHPVREGGASIFREFNDSFGSTYHRQILKACEFSDQFSESAYDRGSQQFNKLRDKITRTLPSPPS
jgi:hypothetical protein